MVSYMKPLKNHPILFVGVVVLTLVLFFILRDGNDALPVTLQTVDKGTVEFTVANTRAGTVKACRRANLAPPIGGQVAKLLVKEGDKVKSNQLLLEIWNADQVAQVKLAQSEALTAKQTAEEVCLRADAAKREERRILELWKDKMTSEEKLDQVQTQVQTTKAACDASLSRVEVSNARLEVAQASLERTRLRAPFDGSIAEINGEIGEYVTPSPPGIPTPPAIDIVDTSCLYILAPIDEVDVPNIVEGMEARITLDAFPKQNFLGAVRRIAPYVLEVEKQARTVDIEAVFMDESEYRVLKPGYSADLEIIIDANYDVVRVPTEAIIEDNKVYVFDQDDSVARLTEIKTGIANWSYTQVLEGLKAGDKIIMSVDREGLKDGASVTPDKNNND